MGAAGEVDAGGVGGGRGDGRFGESGAHWLLYSAPRSHIMLLGYYLPIRPPTSTRPYNRISSSILTGTPSSNLLRLAARLAPMLVSGRRLVAIVQQVRRESPERR